MLKDCNRLGCYIGKGTFIFILIGMRYSARGLGEWSRRRKNFSILGVFCCRGIMARGSTGIWYSVFTGSLCRRKYSRLKIRVKRSSSDQRLVRLANQLYTTRRILIIWLIRMRMWRIGCWIRLLLFYWPSNRAYPHKVYKQLRKRLIGSTNMSRKISV